jgi:hypothetical protein
MNEEDLTHHAISLPAVKSIRFAFTTVPVELKLVYSTSLPPGTAAPVRELLATIPTAM